MIQHATRSIPHYSGNLPRAADSNYDFSCDGQGKTRLHLVPTSKESTRKAGGFFTSLYFQENINK